ncbi:MAG: formate dehydrogenase subunit delta [Alphaproteobacteria bacterium]|nr:formate dehydrogenase subunit delta [Alphaproteobacteria bacterium]
MSDDIKELIRMANQIATFFQSYPEEEAVTGTAEHIRDFWTSAMRARLGRYASDNGNGVHPLVMQAMGRLQQAA